MLLDPLRAVVSVTEHDYGRLRVGQEVGLAGSTVIVLVVVPVVYTFAHGRAEAG